jgi:CRP/FNR family cyclic AMP-dependent transcriptional regulator
VNALDEIRPILPEIFFLRTADEQTRSSFAQLVGVHGYPKGNILFHHGEESLAVYVVIRGRVRISLISEDGREVLLELGGPGTVCGLTAALDGGPHSGTAITAGAARIGVIPRDRFMDWLAVRPRLHQDLLVEIAHMLRNAYQRLGEQALLPVKRRLLQALLEIARTDGRTTSDEVVFIRPTHQELADHIGTTRVVVSRALKELIDEGGDLIANGRVLRVRLHAVTPRVTVDL